MSWTELEPITPPQKSQVVVALIRLGKNGAVKLAVLCRAIVLHDMGNPKTFGVALGEGELKGKLRIAPDSGKFKAAQFAKGGCRLLIKRPDWMPNDTRNPMTVDYKVCEDKSLVLTLPTWPDVGYVAGGDDNAPRPKMPVPASTPPTANKPPAPNNGRKEAFTLRDASRLLMGDPPPGRSALDQKRGGG